MRLELLAIIGPVDDAPVCAESNDVIGYAHPVRQTRARNFVTTDEGGTDAASLAGGERQHGDTLTFRLPSRWTPFAPGDEPAGQLNPGERGLLGGE